MTSRPARHRRGDQSSLASERLLARLAAPSGVAGWVPQRPEPVVPADADRAPARLRWVPTRRAVAGLGLVLLVAVAVAVLLAWQARPSAETAPRVRRMPPSTVAAVGTPGGLLAGPSSASSMPSMSAASAASAASPAAEVVVHVVGAVRRPGLVQLPAGSRVADAVRAAGGATSAARVASVNLARLLVDGEQLVVQRRGGPPIVGAPDASAPGAGTGAGGSAAGSAPASSPVDLNSATLEALDGLPGIGPVLAQRILDWRSAHGRFTTVDELGEVSGIGEATLSDIRPLVTV